jgi:hypothetical protein
MSKGIPPSSVEGPPARGARLARAVQKSEPRATPLRRRPHPVQIAGAPEPARSPAAVHGRSRRPCHRTRSRRFPGRRPERHLSHGHLSYEHRCPLATCDKRRERRQVFREHPGCRSCAEHGLPVGRSPPDEPYAEANGLLGRWTKAVPARRISWRRSTQTASPPSRDEALPTAGRWRGSVGRRVVVRSSVVGSGPDPPEDDGQAEDHQNEPATAKGEPEDGQDHQ